MDRFDEIIKDLDLKYLTGTKYLKPAKIKVEGNRLHVLCEVNPDLQYKGIKFYPFMNDVHETVKIDSGEEHLVEGLKRINSKVAKRNHAVMRNYKEFEGFWRGKFENRSKCVELLGKSSKVNRNYNRTATIWFDASVNYDRVYCVANRYKGEYNLLIKNLSEEQAKKVIQVIGDGDAK